MATQEAAPKAAKTPKAAAPKVAAPKAAKTVKATSATDSAQSKVKVTMMKSFSGRSDTQRKTLRSLGLSRIGTSRVLPNVNPILGQINKVIQYVKVEYVD